MPVEGAGSLRIMLRWCFDDAVKVVCSRPTSSDRKLDSDEEEDKSGMELKNIPVEAAVPTPTASDLEDSVKEVLTMIDNMLYLN